MNAVELRRIKAQKLDEAEALATVENRALTDEERSRIDALMAESSQLEEDAVRMERIEGFRGVSKPSTDISVQVGRTPDTPLALFCRYLRTVDPTVHAELQAATQAEHRASNAVTMNITTAGAGGDLVPVDHYNQIIAKARPMDITSQVGCLNIPGGPATTVNVPVDNETDSGEFISTSESAAFDTDSPAVAKIPFTLVKYTKKVPLTIELLQDEDSGLLAFLEQYVASGYAFTLNKLMIVEALANGTAGLTLASPTTVAAAEVPNLFYKLSADYARGPLAWIMRRATEGVIRGLASSNQFLYAPTPGGNVGNAGSQGTLWGAPVYPDENMGAMTASGKSVLIGNFAYMGKRLDPTMTFLRDPYSRAANGEVLLYYYFRCDFGVLQAAAFQYATQST